MSTIPQELTKQLEDAALQDSLETFPVEEYRDSFRNLNRLAFIAGARWMWDTQYSRSLTSVEQELKSKIKELQDQNQKLREQK